MNDPTRGSAQPPGPPPPPANSGGAATLRAYRDAAAQAGEAPRADTRAAILAAAARQVQSRPQPVGRAAAPLTRYRAPLALAASLLIGTLAWQLAAQFDEPAIGADSVQEAPAATSAPAPAAAPTAPAPAPETAAVAAPDAAARSEEAARARAADVRRAAPAVPSVAGAERSDAHSTLPRAAAAPEVPPEVQPIRPGDREMASKPSSHSTPEAAPAPSYLTAPAPDAAHSTAPAAAAAAGVGPPPKVAAPAAPRTAAPTGAPASAADAPAAMAAPAPPRPAALRMAPAPGAPPAVGSGTSESVRAKSESAPPEEQVRTQPVERRLYNEDAAPRPLAAWIAQVIELRAAGRHAEADRELLALRKHYPQAQIPAAARPAAER